ncbi:MAG TPA: hypothetical protein VGI46_03180 [Candidatus Acidoferrum sp.]
MRSPYYCVVLAILLVILPACASETKRTDAQNDGFVGSVRSVSAREERAQLDWHQPDGPSVTWSMACRECEYDREGNRIKSGQIMDGWFKGEITRFVRDNQGMVIEKTTENAEGEIVRRDVFGPHGITEQHGFEGSAEISSSFWFYDGNGHLSGFRGFARDGDLVSSSFSTSDTSGDYKEEWDYGANGSLTLHFVETNDPRTDTFTFASFKESGSVAVAFTTIGTRVLSYHQETSEEQPFGSNFYVDPVGKTEESYKCHSDGSCDHVINYFSDETRRRLNRVEWHDPTGELKLSADYEYEVDHFGNWTKRTVWVWSSALGERKLFETDYQTLTYWSN